MTETTKRILKMAGFDKEILLIENGICPVCKKVVNKDELRDEESRKEYEFDGMCQKCQDGVFVNR